MAEEKHPKAEVNEIPKFGSTTVVMLDYSDQFSIPEKMKDFLSKILSAVHIEEAQADLVFKKDIQNIREDNFENSTVIAFLSHVPENLSGIFDQAEYQIKNYRENKYLLCDTLEVIHTNQSLKRNLWEKLKELFDISS
jgi:hypothetical protein